MWDYYWTYYKKYIITGGIVITSVIMSIFSYKYFSVHKNISVKNLGNNDISIKVDNKKQEIKLNFDNKEDLLEDKNIKDKRKYSYQVKITLGDFDLNCNGDKKVCEKVIENKSLLKNFILGNYSGDLVSLSDFKLNIKDFFEKKFNKKGFLANSKELLYDFQKNLIKENNIKNTGFEKYFEFKKKNPNDKITLNNLEIQCASEVKMAVIPGTFEEDRIIKEKVEQNCKNLGGEQILTIESNTEKKVDFSLNVNIKNVNVQYDFFEKNNGTYRNIESKKVKFNYNKKIN